MRWGYRWNELNRCREDGTGPKTIADGLIAEHRRFSLATRETRIQTWRLAESKDPAHVALSLTGEPLFYPEIGARSSRSSIGGA